MKVEQQIVYSRTTYAHLFSIPHENHKHVHIQFLFLYF